MNKSGKRSGLRIFISILTTIAIFGIIIPPPASAADWSDQQGNVKVLLTNNQTCNVSFAYQATYEDGQTYTSELNSFCDTFFSVNGELYGTRRVRVDGQDKVKLVRPSTSMPKISGSGTAGDPRKIEYLAKAGETGVSIEETHTYSAAEDSFTTETRIINEGSDSVEIKLYRLTPCSIGYTMSASSTSSSPGRASCHWDATAGRTEKLVQFTDISDGQEVANAADGEYAYDPTFPGLLFMMVDNEDFETHPSVVFPGIGLNWNLTIPAGSSEYRYSKISTIESEAGGDSDWDGLPDQWEKRGLNVDGEHLPLHELGANVGQRDLFLQVNWMKRPDPCKPNFRDRAEKWKDCSVPIPMAPEKNSIKALHKAFSNQGIALHIDAGPDHSVNWTGPYEGGQVDRYDKYYYIMENNEHVQEEKRMANMTRYRNSFMNPARQKVFYHMVLGDSNAPGNVSTGVSLTPGDSSFVSIRNARQGADQAGAMMHEFGHSLGLNHGGPKGGHEHELNCKPEYKSRMNYLYQSQEGEDFDFTHKSDRNVKKVPHEKQEWCEGQAEGLIAGDLYGYDSDWDNLFFGSGEIGGPAEGSSLEGELIEEPPAELLRELSGSGEEHRAVLAFTGRPFVISGASGQSILLEVENRASVDADYRVQVEGQGVAFDQFINLAAGERKTLTIPVDGTNLLGETMDLTAVVTTDDDEETARTEAFYSIVDMTPEDAQALLDVNSSDNGDPQVAEILDIARERADETEQGSSTSSGSIDWGSLNSSLGPNGGS